jgi:hypothetical protein
MSDKDAAIPSPFASDGLAHVGFLQRRAHRVVHLLVSVLVGPMIAAAILCLIFLPLLLSFVSAEGGLVLVAIMVSALVVGFPPAVLSAALSIVASLKIQSARSQILLSPVFGAFATVTAVFAIAVAFGEPSGPVLLPFAGLAGLGAAAGLGSMLITYRLTRSRPAGEADGPQ